LPRRFLIRELAIVALTALAWMTDERLHARHDATAYGVAVVTALLTAYAGFLAHEWGHLLLARVVGSVVSYPRSLFSSLLFHFDSAHNDRRQFMWMSAGGYLASLVGVALIVAFVPLRLSGWLSIAFAGAGVLATFILEIPITVRVLRGASLPSGSAYRPHVP
jgi:membrane-associated protease RseP (regulator of RpoE activity)